MYGELFIHDFVTLGKHLNDILLEDETISADKLMLNKSYANNPFYTPQMQKRALRAICDRFLDESNLVKWVSEFSVSPTLSEKSVGLIMAGNIPLVGFHDLLCVLACGFKAVIKASSRDIYLPEMVVSTLYEINPFWRGRISFKQSIDPAQIDCIIAAGSDTTVRALNLLYNGVPVLARGSRWSVATIQGNETDDELSSISDDIFLYFGLGCRSVTQLLLPNGYNTIRLAQAFEKWRGEITANEAWMASYNQMRAISLIEGREIVDFGFILLGDFGKTPPPVGCVNLIRYSSAEEAIGFIERNRGQIQAVCSASTGVAPGQMQYPSLSDYADGIDTVDFLLNHIN